MDQEKLKLEAKEKLEDISSIIEKIKNQKVEELDKIEYEALVKELEDIRNKMKEKFDAFDSSVEKKWDEFDKNIYQDIQSFNNAYMKAGHIFKPGKGSRKSERE
ncbi:MAG: hypothetical protein KFF49_02785 [Bacteroidales bacterium]|nr:hypothetical protein [Bacteroidales bacterium]